MLKPGLQKTYEAYFIKMTAAQLLWFQYGLHKIKDCLKKLKKKKTL